MTGSSAPNGLVHQHHPRPGCQSACSARPTRWRCPPDSAAGRRPAISRGRAIRERSSAVRSAIRGRVHPASRGPTAMFSPMLRCGKRPISWNHVTYPPTQGGQRIGAHHPTLHRNGSIVGQGQSVDHLQGRGLAAAGGAQEGDELALVDRQRQRPEHLPARIGLGDAVERDHASRRKARRRESEGARNSGLQARARERVRRGGPGLRAQRPERSARRERCLRRRGRRRRTSLRVCPGPGKCPEASACAP